MVRKNYCDREADINVPRNREELKIVSSMALNLAKSSPRELDSVAAELVGW